MLGAVNGYNRVASGDTAYAYFRKQLPHNSADSVGAQNSPAAYSLIGCIVVAAIVSPLLRIF